MATKIGNISVILSVSGSRFNKGLKAAQARLGSFAKRITRFRNLVAGGLFAAMVKQSLDSLDQLSKAASKLGVTTEALGRLRFAGEQTGIALRTMDMALQRFTRRVAEAAIGTGEAQGALRDLGLDASALAAMGTEAAFGAVADAMRRIPDAGQQLRIAFKLFDSEGAALVNTLRLGSEGITQLGDTAEKLGRALSQDMVDRAVEARDALGRMKNAALGLRDSFVVALTPAITKASNIVAGIAIRLRTMSDETKASILNFVKVSAQIIIVAKVLASLITALKGVAIGQALVLALGGPAGWATIAAGAAFATAAIIGINAALKDVGNTLNKLDELGSGIPNITRDANEMGEALATAASKLEDPLKKSQTILNGLSQKLRNFGKSADEIAIRDLIEDPAVSAQDLSVASDLIRRRGLLEEQAKLADKGRKTMDKWFQSARRLSDELQTPMERFKEELNEVINLWRIGLITPDTFKRAFADLKQRVADVGGAIVQTARAVAPRALFKGSTGAARAAQAGRLNNVQGRFQQQTLVANEQQVALQQLMQTELARIQMNTRDAGFRSVGLGDE